MSSPALPERFDVVVVGARVAGAATAMLLARFGLEVLAVERGAYGSDTVSTHALMRAGVLQLARWGLLDRLRHAGTPVRKTTFIYGDQAVAAYKPGRRRRLTRRAHRARRFPSCRPRGGRRGCARSRWRRTVACGIEVIDTSAGGEPWRPGWWAPRAHVPRAVKPGAALAARRGLRVSTATSANCPTTATSGATRPARRPAPSRPTAACVFVAVSASGSCARLTWRAGTRGFWKWSRPIRRRSGEAQQLERLRGFRRAGVPSQAWGLAGRWWATGFGPDRRARHALRAREPWRAPSRAGERSRRLPAAHALSRLLDVTSAVASYDWTLDEVQTLHRELSESMKREVAFALGGVRSRARRTA